LVRLELKLRHSLERARRDLGGEETDG
jgi:hypothetical protein